MTPRREGPAQRNGKRWPRWNRRRDYGPDHDVAVLALAAAVATAVLSGGAAWLSSQAGGEWQAALREELRWSTAAVEDIRFVYNDEAPYLLRADLADARADALRKQAAGNAGLPSEVARAEARMELELGFRTRQVVGLRPYQQPYRLPDGGLDLERRLADERNRNPDLVGLDPEPEQTAGNRASRRAAWVAAASVPVAAAFILAALATLAQRSSRNRLLLLRCGYVLLGVSALMAFGGVLS
jgi:hypothetical protein